MPPLKIQGKKRKRGFKPRMASVDPKDKKSIMKSFLKLLFGHIGLFFIVVVYAIVGCYILIYIESDAEEYRFEQKKIAARDIRDSLDYIVNYAWFLSTEKQDQTAYTEKMRTTLDLYHKFIVKKAIETKYDGDADYWNYDWTFAKSLLFTVTTMGAIGYGHIYPKTSNGQIFTIYYGMIGVPLLLLFLANIGEFLANSFRYIYSRLCCRLCRIRRKATTLRGNEALEKKILWKDEVGIESFMPTSQVDVPIMVNLCVIFVYLMIGGVIFSNWENWTITESVYFTFITLTTIGFGDYVPGNSFMAGGDQALISMLKMIVTMLFTLLGMALVSMAINLMQEQIVAKAKWVATQIGAEEEIDKNAKRYQIKKSGAVTSTPSERDGNFHSGVLLDSTDDDEEELLKSMEYD